MSTKARKGNRLTDVCSAIFAKNYNKCCKNTLIIISKMLKTAQISTLFLFQIFFIFPINRKLMIFQNCSYRFLNRFSHRG